MAQIEITLGEGCPSVKINGEEMNGKITELTLSLKPLMTPELNIKMGTKDIAVKGNASIVSTSKNIHKCTVNEKGISYQITNKERTFGDLKKAFEKITKAAADLRSDEQRFEEAKKSFTKILDDEETWKKDFLTRDFTYSDTPINHDLPEGYVKITELDLAVGDYIARQRLRKDKSVLADPFVPDQYLSEFIKAYWSKHCDPQNNE